MAEGFVQVAPDSTGKKIRNQELSIAGNTVEQQVITIAKADGTLDPTIPVSLATVPLPTGASTEATLALIKAKTDNLDVLLSTRTKPADVQNVSVTASVLPTGAATEATLGTRLSESDFDTKTGAVTEIAPATDTASSGLNGRLQRIAQRITSLIALFPAALVGGRFDTNVGSWLGSTVPTVGQKTMANSVPVVIASDQSSVPVSTPRPSTATQTNVGSMNTQQTLLVSNVGRRKFRLVNDTGKVLFWSLTATATATNFAGRLASGAEYESDLDDITGIVTGIAPGANAANPVRVTEYT